jgi:GH25 family lysozyme M1 (1,4-beta-N-acetylmuramidase)
MSWHRMSSPADAKAGELFADISANQSTFNAAAYASAGHRLIMIKATQGENYLNPAHASWTTSAHLHGLAVAHYHFCELSNPLLEARAFWERVRPVFDPARDRLVLDLEIGNPATWPTYLRELDNELLRYSTLKAVLYTFASAVSPQLVVRSGKYHLAAWGTRQPSGPFRRLINGGTLWAWQYTDDEIDPAAGPRAFAGIGPCDGSVLNPNTLRNINQHR